MRISDWSSDCALPILVSCLICCSNETTTVSALDEARFGHDGAIGMAAIVPYQTWDRRPNFIPHLERILPNTGTVTSNTSQELNVRLLKGRIQVASVQPRSGQRVAQ